MVSRTNPQNPLADLSIIPDAVSPALVVAGAVVLVAVLELQLMLKTLA